MQSHVDIEHIVNNNLSDSIMSYKYFDIPNKLKKKVTKK